MSLVRNIRFGLGLLLILFVYCLFPGNVDWICDQPLLIAKALEANRANRWGELGIAGGNGTVYGPVPNFIYQVALRTTQDLVNLVVIKVILSFGMILFGLLRISRDLNLKKEGVFFAFLSPLIYFYSRSLWDNVFLIPISAIYCSAIIAYCNRRRPIDFILAIASGWLMFHIHLMALIVLAPGIAAINFVGMTKDKKKMASLFFVQLIFGVLSFPYLKTLLLAKTLATYGHRQWFAILLSPVLGARLFGYFGFFEYFSPNFLPSLPSAVKYGVCFLMLFTAIGSICFLLGLKKLLSKKSGFLPSVRGFFIGVLAMTVLISLKMGLKAHPHYMNASWPVYLCLLWKVYSDENEKNQYRTLWRVYSVSMALLLCVWIGYIEVNSGDRGVHFGPSMKNQIEIAANLPSRNPLERVTISVENFSEFPQRLIVLAKLYGKGEEDSKRRRLVYRKEPPSAEIGLISEEGAK